jgi:hypothetical protein
MVTAHRAYTARLYRRVAAFPIFFFGSEVKRVLWHEIAHWLGYEPEQQVEALRELLNYIICNFSHSRCLHMYNALIFI